MSTYLTLRLLKTTLVVALGAGTVGAFLPTSLADRRRAAYAIAGPAFGGTWLTGFLLAYWTGVSLLSTWVLTSLALSFFSIQVVLYAVGREGRRRPIPAFLAIAALFATIALMTVRPS